MSMWLVPHSGQESVIVTVIDCEEPQRPCVGERHRSLRLQECVVSTFTLAHVKHTTRKKVRLARIYRSFAAKGVSLADFRSV